MSTSEAESIPSSIILSPIEKDLIRDEGYRTNVYKDTKGLLTIGVGHNLTAKGLCPEAIIAQLRFDLGEVHAQLSRAIPWWTETPEACQRVLLNLGFNLGVPGLLKFNNTLQLIHSKQYARAADALLKSAYAAQVGQRAVRLAMVLRAVI